MNINLLLSMPYQGSFISWIPKLQLGLP